MKTIEISDSVYTALSQRVKGFGETPNTVIERLLNRLDELEKPTLKKLPPAKEPSHDEAEGPLTKLITSLEYQRCDAVGRYISILSKLYKINPGKFEQLTRYRRKGGKRVNFAKSSQEIEQSGSSTYPQPITGTPFFVLTNLDNRSKRHILADVLPFFGISKNHIQEVIKTIPDSGITRSVRLDMIV